MALDDEARLQVRELMRRTFARIDMYTRGFAGAASGVAVRLARRVFDYSAIGDGDEPIDVALHGRNGVVRMLSVNRRSGAWRAGAALDAAQLRALLARSAAGKAKARESTA